MPTRIPVPKLSIYHLIVLAFAAIWPISGAYAQAPNPFKTFTAVGRTTRFATAPAVDEFVFQERRGPSSFDRVGLHRITSGSMPAAHPGIVLLYLPGTNMNGEIAIADPRFSLPLYLAAHGVDFWTFDYRTHFVPASTRPDDLSPLQSWTNEMF